MNWYDHNLSGWGYAGMTTVMVLFWAVVIVGIVALIRFVVGTAGTRTDSPPQPRTETSEQLLAARFARGEIDELEFQQRLAVLRAALRP